MENKKVCPHCKQEVDPKASRCPHCQGKIYQWTTGRKVMAGFLGLFLLFSIISVSLNSSESGTQFEEQQAADLAEWQQTPAGKLCAEHPTWKRPACDAIVKEKVIVGMTKEQAIAAWGKPKDINTTATANGTHEQWVYGLSSYLYFDNGVLTAAQN